MTYDGGLCFPLWRIANMDQTPLPFEYLCGRTYACKGDETVWAESIRSGWDKRQATLVLTVFADGIPYVKPDILFRGTDNPALQESYYGEERKHYDPRVDVHFNKKGYCNEGTTVKYITEKLVPAFTSCRCNLPVPVTVETTSKDSEPQPRACQCQELGKAGLIVLDAAKFHRTALVKETLAQHSIILPLTPGGTIGLSDSWGPCSTWPSSPGTAASESRANTKRPPTEWACPRWVSSAQHDSESSRQRAALHRPKRC